MSIDGKKAHLAKQKQFEDPTAFAIQFDPTQKIMSGTAIHGNTPFSMPIITELVDGFWQGGTETGLTLPRNIEHLVSMYPWEKYNVKHDLKSELYVRMYDSEQQAFGQVDSIARWVNERREEGVVLSICQAGLNRSSLVAARALILEGYSADEAISLIRAKRSPACLCNRSFERWLRETE